MTHPSTPTSSLLGLFHSLLLYHSTFSMHDIWMLLLSAGVIGKIGLSSEPKIGLRRMCCTQFESLNLCHLYANWSDRVFLGDNLSPVIKLNILHLCKIEAKDECLRWAYDASIKIKPWCVPVLYYRKQCVAVPWRRWSAECWSTLSLKVISPRYSMYCCVLMGDTVECRRVHTWSDKLLSRGPCS